MSHMDELHRKNLEQRITMLESRVGWLERRLTPPVVNGVCRECGRDYRGDQLPNGRCPSDDCPSNTGVLTR